DRVEPGAKVRVEIEGRYTFGKPVAGGAVELRLGTDVRRPLWENELKLDAAGRTAAELEIPQRTAELHTRLTATLSDETGRSVTEVLQLEIAGNGVSQQRAFAGLARFIRAGDTLTIPAAAEAITVAERIEANGPKKTRSTRVPVHEGKAVVAFREPG